MIVVENRAQNRHPLDKMTLGDSLLIGLAQALALVPGVSRSGITITTGLFRGYERAAATRFSFLLSIPAILGATLLEFRKMSGVQDLWTTLIGTAIAFGVGILSLTFLMRIIRMGKISNFSYYCWGIGILIILLTK
jgi:undecaprenyl-diphosphatase